jgi:hypothetical protein
MSSQPIEGLFSDVEDSSHFPLKSQKEPYNVLRYAAWSVVSDFAY